MVLLIRTLFRLLKKSKAWTKGLGGRRRASQPLTFSLACFRSVHFDHRLISAPLIQFSICFIVNDEAGWDPIPQWPKKKRDYEVVRAEKGGKEEGVVGRAQ